MVAIQVKGFAWMVMFIPIFDAMKYSSKILEEAVEAISALPSIGKKSALRLALHLAAKSSKTERIMGALRALNEDLKVCDSCFAYADHDTCSICLDPARSKATLCVVGSVKDVMAIENTQQYTCLLYTSPSPRDRG